MAKNSKRKQNENNKKNFGAYGCGREEDNRLRKLRRHVKNFPMDLVSVGKLASFEAKGVPHRRKMRSVGIKLSESDQHILNHKGKRLTGAKIKLLKLLNNPSRTTPDGAMSYDKLVLVLNKHIRVRYKTSMQHAMDKAKEVQRNEALFA